MGRRTQKHSLQQSNAYASAHMGDTARRRTDDPNEEEERDEARCQNRYDGLNGSAEGAHRQPRHHPINYKARTTVAGVITVSAGSM